MNTAKDVLAWASRNCTRVHRHVDEWGGVSIRQLENPDRDMADRVALAMKVLAAVEAWRKAVDEDVCSECPDGYHDAFCKDDPHIPSLETFVDRAMESTNEQ